MGKVSKLDTAITELRNAAAAINNTADTLVEMFSGSNPQTPEKTSPAKPALSLEQVRAVLADKSRHGHTAEIRDLLKKYGAAKLSQIAPANYEALLRDAEVLSSAE